MIRVWGGELLFKNRWRCPLTSTALSTGSGGHDILAAFVAHRLELLDDIAEFFGERAIENFVFALPIEFQAAAVQE